MPTFDITLHQTMDSDKSVTVKPIDIDRINFKLNCSETSEIGCISKEQLYLANGSERDCREIKHHKEKKYLYEVKRKGSFVKFKCLTLLSSKRNVLVHLHSAHGRSRFSPFFL